ncbi:hypothetical protein C1H46_005541 [Malus baccata]|uniref:Oberon-like PHD finger domain-containing protein n=1 Tax=Malus baccata TaxID=106549 RepID=A0A540NDZ4_MALBA|nr:hypothetical protein C1H46_005541 [Malus baccata]
MAGTVGGSIGLDSEYYCWRCDEKTNLVSYVTRLLLACESLDSRDDVEKILNFGICILRGSQKTSARDLLKRIEVAIEKVSSIRANKSDDKQLSIFTGTKTLHLRCVTREDRATWSEALLDAKDLFPRVFTSNDLVPSEDIVVSTEKLRLRLAQEGIGEPVIKDCESIMLLEVSELQNQMKGLQRKHVMLLESLRQIEIEKIELDTTVVDETKERESYGQGNGRFSGQLSFHYLNILLNSLFSHMRKLGKRLHGVEEIKTIK